MNYVARGFLNDWDINSYEDYVPQISFSVIWRVDLDLHLHKA